VAKKQAVSSYVAVTKVKRRNKPKGLNVRKKLGPKSNMRIKNGY